MKKRIFFILLAAMLMISSCGVTPSAEETEANVPQAEDTATEETRTEAEDENPDTTWLNRTFEEDGLGQTDFGGYGFTVYYPDEAPYTIYLFAEEDTGDSMGSALYYRDARCGDRANVGFTWITKGGIMDTSKYIGNSVTAGDNAYDIVVTHAVCSNAGLVTSGLLHNLNSVPNLDFTKSYWNAQMNRSLSINGVLPLASSDLLIPYPNAIFFNKDIASDMSMESIYDTVKSGAWTVDKMAELSAKVYKDENGNGQYDSTDIYGFASASDWMYDNFQYGCGVYVTDFAEDGTIKMVLAESRMSDVVDKIYSFVTAPTSYFMKSYDSPDSIAFESGNVLFYIVPLAKAANYRTTDVNFGILPFPKLDEAQESYISFDWGGLIGLPISLSGASLDRSGYILEMLSCESSRTVIGAYFDILLNGKVTRDIESGEMLDIIYSTLTYDFGVTYSDNCSSAYALGNIISEAKGNFASWYKRNEKMCMKQYQTVADAFADMAD